MSNITKKTTRGDIIIWYFLILVVGSLAYLYFGADFQIDLKNDEIVEKCHNVEGFDRDWPALSTGLGEYCLDERGFDAERWHAVYGRSMSTHPLLDFDCDAIKNGHVDDYENIVRGSYNLTAYCLDPNHSHHKNDISNYPIDESAVVDRCNLMWTKQLAYDCKINKCDYMFTEARQMCLEFNDSKYAKCGVIDDHGWYDQCKKIIDGEY